MQTIKQVRQSYLPKITKAIVPNNTLNSILQKEPIRGPYECNIKSMSVYKYLSYLSFYARDKKTYFKNDNISNRNTEFMRLA